VNNSGDISWHKGRVSARAAEGKTPWAVDAGYLPPQLVMAAEQYMKATMRFEEGYGHLRR